MRRTSARALALCALACSALACGRPGSPRLEGRWRGVRAEGMAGESLASANVFATRTELQVRGDMITVTAPNETQSGRYRVVYENDTSVTITTDKDGPESPQTFAFEGPKSLRWLAAPGECIVFVRQ